MSKRIQPKPIIRKAFTGTTLEELRDELGRAFSDLQNQIGASGRILPHKNQDNNRPRGIRSHDRLMGRGTRGTILGVPDDTGAAVAQVEVPDSVTQYQDPQTGTGAPTTTQFPNSGDFGWYQDTGASTVYFVWNNAGTVTGPSLSILSGSITAAQHGILTNNAVARHSNVTATVDGFMVAADKVKLDAATTATTASTLVLRSGGGGINAVQYNVNGTLVVAAQDTGWSMAGGLILDKSMVAFTPGVTYTATDLTKIMKYVNAIFDLVINRHGLAGV